MGASGSAGGDTQSSTTKQSLPAWETPIAKAYLSSLAGMTFPGLQVPNNYFPKNYSFGQMQGNVAPGGGGGGAPVSTGGGAQNAGLDAAFMNPGIAGSSYLQSLYGNNPAAANGAAGGAAYQQLGQIYPALAKTGMG